MRRLSEDNVIEMGKPSVEAVSRHPQQESPPGFWRSIQTFEKACMCGSLIVGCALVTTGGIMIAGHNHDSNRVVPAAFLIVLGMLSLAISSAGLAANIHNYYCSDNDFTTFTQQQHPAQETTYQAFTTAVTKQ